MIGSLSEENDLETKARLILDEYNRQSSEACFKSASANWNYAVNINDDNEKIKLRESLETPNSKRNRGKIFPASSKPETVLKILF
jgi:hypothetical protein